MDTIKDLAGFLKISPAAIRKWQKKGLPFLKCGRLTRFDRAEVLVWLKTQQGKRHNGKND